MRSAGFVIFLTGFLLSVTNLHAGLIINRQAQDSLPDITINVDTQPASDLSEHQTYAWMPAPELKIDNPKYKDLDLHAWVREAADRELQSKGYKKQGYGEPGFWVTYFAAIDSDGTAFENPIDKGTLAIGIVGSDRQKMWQASAAGEVRQNVEPQARKERLGKVVSKMMTSVPDSHSVWDEIEEDVHSDIAQQQQEMVFEAREMARDF